MAYNPMNPQGMYSPTNTSTYVPPKKKTTTNDIPGMGSKTLINVQQGLVAPAKGTIPGISNTNVLTGVQSAIKPTTKKDEVKNSIKTALANIGSKTTKEKIDILKKASKLYGKQNVIDTVNDITKDNPTMAGVFAQYLEKQGIKPLVTPIDTTPKPLPEVTSTITTPGLGDSQALIEAQSEIKPEKEKPSVKVDVDKEKNKPAKDKIDEITGGKDKINKKDSDKIIEDLNKQETDALDKATTSTQKNDIMKYFNKLQKEITRRTISQLKAGKEQALISLGQAQAALAPQYESQRARAATTSMQQARNFGEYLAARGQATSGLAAQAELSRGTGLTRQLGEIGQQQQAAQDQLNANKAKIQSDFQLAIANAKSDAEIAKLNEQFRQAIKQEDRAYQEKITADNRAYAAKLLAEDKEYQDMLFKRNRAIQLQDTASARKYNKEMIDYEAKVNLNLATQKAALTPPSSPSEPKYDYTTDPNYQDAYSQIINGNWSVDTGNGVQTISDPQQIYDSIIAERLTLVSMFGEDGYKILEQTARGKLPKQQVDEYGRPIIQ